MKMLYLPILFSLSFLFSAFTQNDIVWMHPNQGQWDSRIEYKVELSAGEMYIEKDGFLYYLSDVKEKMHHHEEAQDDESDGGFNFHVIRSRFIGSTWSGEREESTSSTFYRNYFYGNDPAQWKTEIYSHRRILLKNFYQGIDMVMESGEASLKYSLEVNPGIDANQVLIEYSGQDKLEIDKSGNLIVYNRFGKILEQKPVAWTEKDGVKRNVDVEFVLSKKGVSFNFPNGYNKEDKLVIDPNLIFSTFTGSTTDNWGMTATPGPNGEMYAAGISFGVGYPTTVGAFDVSYNSGTANSGLPGFDISITKFNSTGNSLIYSTYLGGSANELPQSLITNSNGDLFILGITASSNFPMGFSAYDATFNGGASVSANSLSFVGSDICVTRLNANGTTLLGSTYIGGAGNDGLNISNLNYNYGDQFRGEIILDGSDNVYFSSHTISNDFPVTNGTSLSGTQDAVAAKLDGSLSNLLWSSYYGGSGIETGNSIDLSTTNELFIAGGTTSANLNVSGIDPSFGGISDGYLLKINSVDGSGITGTYMGDSEYDQTYFVRLDIDDNVYVYGQTETSWSITPGCYGNPNSGQFIRKYVNDLSSISLTTMFGAGSGHPEISPTAFMISDCYDVFVSGWGGQVNATNSNQAFYSSSNNFPITPNAYQSTTNGSNFYLGILGNNLSSLAYGTYIGGLSASYNHVDGGTSRFDRSGAVYHAVCAACGGDPNGFTTTPGAWSTSNPSPNCNLAAFKFQLGIPYSLSPNSIICNGESIQISVTGGVTYSWSPAESLSDPNIPNPIATPTSTTVYYVDMDFNEGCSLTDSIIVEVIDVPLISLNEEAAICFGDTITLNATGNSSSYIWSPNSTIDNVNNQVVNVWPTQSQYYYCTGINECFSNIDSIFINVNPLPQSFLSADTIVCLNHIATIYANNTVDIIWIPDSDLTVINNYQAQVNTQTAGYFYAVGSDENNCENIDSVFVDFFPEPELIISNDTSICFTNSIQLSVTGADSYVWSPDNGTLSNPFSSTTIATPMSPTMYHVMATYAQGCVSEDSVFIDVIYMPSSNLPDSLVVCSGVPTILNVTGADSYSWTPETYLDVTDESNVIITAFENINYTVTFSNICGSITEDLYVFVIKPQIEAFSDTIVCPGEAAIIYATGGVSYGWSPASSIIDNPNSAIVSVQPFDPTVYHVTGWDASGCPGYDSVFVDLYPEPWVNTNPDVYAFLGDEIQLNASASSSGLFIWSPGEYLSCVNCSSPVAIPNKDFSYQVLFVDENGCIATDSIHIYYDPILYVPNTFTPDGNEFNNLFRAKGGNIAEFEMLIFDRWGELIYTITSLEDSWDGTYNGVKCQDGTYVWKAEFTDYMGKKYQLTGHVNLIR